MKWCDVVLVTQKLENVVFCRYYALIWQRAPKVCRGASHQSHHFWVKFCTSQFRFARVIFEKVILYNRSTCIFLWHMVANTICIFVFLDYFYSRRSGQTFCVESHSCSLNLLPRLNMQLAWFFTMYLLVIMEDKQMNCCSCRAYAYVYFLQENDYDSKDIKNCKFLAICSLPFLNVICTEG